MRFGSLLVLTLPTIILAAATEPNAPPAGTPLKAELPDEKPSDQANLPPGALLRLGDPRGPRMLERHFSYSPDGKFIAAGTSERTVKVWEVGSRKVVHTFGPFEHPGVSSQTIAKLVFSSDGKALAVAAGKTAHLFDLATGKEVGKFAGHEHVINDLAFSKDGARVVTASYDQTAAVWDRGSFRRLHTLGKFDNAVFAVAFSPDGATVAAADYKGVTRLWKMSDGSPLRDLAGLKSLAHSLRFDDDGKTLTATTYEDGLVTWDVAGGQVKRRVPEWKGLAFPSPDGLVVVVAKDYYATGPVTVWDVKSGKEVGKTADNVGVSHVAVAPDNKTLATYGGDGILRFWKLPSGEEIDRPVGHQDRVSGVGFTRDGNQVISCSEDGTVRFWDAVTGKELKRFSARGEHVHALALSPDGKSLALAASNVPNRWRWGAHGAAPSTSLRFFDIDAGKETRAFHVGGETAHWLRFGPGGREVFALSWSGARLIDPATGKERALPIDAKQGLPAGDVSPDGRYAATSTNVPALRQIGKVAYFDLKENKEVFSKTFYLGGYSGLAFTPDGKHLAVAGTRDLLRGDDKKSRSPLQLWEVPTDKAVRDFETGDMNAQHLIFSRDGRMLAAVEGDAVNVYEVATGKRRFAFKGHEGGINCVAFSRDGRRLASGGLDARALVWDLTGAGGTAVKLEPRDLDALWNSLASDEGPVAAKAIGRLQARPHEALPYLRLRLTVLSEADVRRIAALVKDLDDPQFKVRDAAAKEIERIGEPAVPVLKRALNGGSTEVQQAAERLLKKIGDGEEPTTSADARRLIRAVEVLERIGNEGARALLKDLARRGGKLVQVREAEGALKRFEGE